MLAPEHLFFRRPRILDLLHRLHVANPTTQTTAEERIALSRYAMNARRAVEIGTYQGVSAAQIASAMAPGGLLYCVDPWPEVDGKTNRCLSICTRHLRRSGVAERIRILRCCSHEAGEELPGGLDFAFIDGDHSRNGIDIDWGIISSRMNPGGVVCLHDSVVPPDQEWRHLESCEYFQEVIQSDPRFITLEIVHSVAVLRRVC